MLGSVTAFGGRLRQLERNPYFLASSKYETRVIMFSPPNNRTYGFRTTYFELELIFVVWQWCKGREDNNDRMQRPRQSSAGTRSLYREKNAGRG